MPPESDNSVSAMDIDGDHFITNDLYRHVYDIHGNLDVQPHQDIMSTPTRSFHQTPSSQPPDPPPEIPPANNDDYEEAVEPYQRPPGNTSPKMQSKEYCITLPQCNDTPSALWNRVKAHPLVSRGLSHFAAVSEFHEDGNRHLHAYIKYTSKPAFRMSAMDQAMGKHGNYGKPRGGDPKHWLRYMLKHQVDVPIDDEYHMIQVSYNVGQGQWVDWDISALANMPSNKQGKFETVVANLVANKYAKFDEWIATMPHGMVQHLTKLRDIYAYYRGIWDAPPRAPLDEVPYRLLAIEDPEVAVMKDYLNKLIAHTRATNDIVDLPQKQNVIVAHGASNTHKSSFVQRLGQFLEVVGIDFQKAFPFNGVIPERPPQVVWLDEFDGKDEQIPQPLLFNMFDAFPNKAFNHKGAFISFHHRPLFIVTTNTRPSQWYTTRVVTGDLHIPEVLRDNLSPEHRNGLNNRIMMSVEVKTPIMGFPDPTPATAFVYGGNLPKVL